MTAASIPRRSGLAALAALALSACASSSEPPPPPALCADAGVPGTCRADCGRYDTGTAGACSGGLLCCTPATAVACDSSAMPLPILGGVDGDPGPGPGPWCPGSMALVDTFCIDKYENTLTVVATGEPWSPYWNPGATPVRARSAKHSVPQGYVSGTQAAAACAAAGRRLCTDAEWLRACQGPDGTTYPYGNTYVAGNCNDTRAVHPAVELFGTNDAWIFGFLDHPCLNQLPASLGETWTRSACITAEGVYDMVGNLAEWTADPSGTFRGGDYVSAALNLNGFGCENATTAHDVSHHDYTTGFRCCADAQ